MPSDANGFYSLPAGYLATPGAKIKPSQHNPIFEDIAVALSARVSKNGTAAMTGALQGYGGSAAAPGYTFDGSENYGFFKTANGIGVSINGVQVVEFTSSGVLKSSRYIGELIPWSRVTAPPLCVLPIGQTLSRVTYADLWGVAQAEIAVGNTFFNNGDGSSTFGIGDLRGRVLACLDGGTGRLTTAGGGVDGPTLGAVGGAQNAAILQTNLPASTLTTAITDPGHGHTSGPASLTSVSYQAGGTSTGNLLTTTATGSPGGQLAASNTTGISASTALGGSGTALKIPQPTLVTNYALFAGV